MFAADKPIRHVEDDKYGREKYVDNLAYALLTGDDSDGLVVGIEGAWGSGKTSLKNMLIERLQQMPLPDRKTHLIEFDAWMYSRSGEIVSALFSEISAGLSPRLKWYQKLLMRFDCFNNNAITSVVHLIYRAINAVLPYSEIGISIGCISWSFQNLSKIIYVFLTIFLYLLKCPQSLILSALRAFCFCGKPHISRSIFLYFRYQAWLKSW